MELRQNFPSLFPTVPDMLLCNKRVGGDGYGMLDNRRAEMSRSSREAFEFSLVMCQRIIKH